MDITFITMHDLGPEATTLYASDSIVDSLNRLPRDVIGKPLSAMVYEEDVAKALHIFAEGIEADGASEIGHFRLKRRKPDDHPPDAPFEPYISCECVFTIVYSVVVACISLYSEEDPHSHRRMHAPAVREIFMNPPGVDNRYHMIHHLSEKFLPAPPPQKFHEPRAAMILNRFTKTLTVMYATHSIEDVLGIPAEEVLKRSFYDGISEECLVDAIDAIDRAKENDSIAFLRFKWDPSRRRRSASQEAQGAGGYQEASQNGSDGGVPLDSDEGSDDATTDEDDSSDERDSLSSPDTSVSDTGTTAASRPMPPPVDIEAVISCTSDGLVVVIKKARPLPADFQANYPNGIFAAPWATVPRFPENYAVDPSYHYEGYKPHTEHRRLTRVIDPQKEYDFMNAIQNCAVFAWSLRSINKDILMHAREQGPPPSYIAQVGTFPNPKGTYDRRSRRWTKSSAAAEAARQVLARGEPVDPNGYASLGYSRRRHPYTRRGRK